MQTLIGIEAEFQRLRELGTLDRRLELWCENRPGLRRVGSVRELIELCRASEKEPLKNGALTALCLESKLDDVAGVLLSWLLLPVVWNAVRELPSDVLDPEDLAGELLGGLWATAARIDEGTADVAGRLVNGVRWAGRQAIRKALAWKYRVVATANPALDRPIGGEPEEDLLARAVATGIVSHEEIEMLLCDRTEVSDLADRLGLTLEVFQRRRSRARARLATWLKHESRDLHAREDRAKR